MMESIEKLVEKLKCRVKKTLKLKKEDYDKIEKSDSMRVEIRSRKARKLIDKTLKIADSPRRRTIFAF